MRILVTGGAGFIGSHYVRSVLAGAYPRYRNARVTVLDKLTYAGNTSSLPLDHPRLRFVRGDLCDQSPLADVLPGHDAVVHFAAESHVDRSLAGARNFVLANVLGTQNLLDCCLRAAVPRVVCVSTDEVYGDIRTGSCAEDHLLAPNSPYAASKAGADHLAHAYHRTYGMEILVTRCSNNYGPYQFIEKLIPLFVTNLLDRRAVPVYGDGRNIREWVHVDDHCRAIQLVLENGRPGQVYNIGGGVAQTNLELTGRLLDLCHADWGLVRFVRDRQGHDFRYALDDSRIRDELGYRPVVPFETGLADVVQWYRDNRWWWEPLRAKTTAGNGAPAA